MASCAASRNRRRVGRKDHPSYPQTPYPDHTALIPSPNNIMPKHHLPPFPSLHLLHHLFSLTEAAASHTHSPLSASLSMCPFPYFLRFHSHLLYGDHDHGPCCLASFLLCDYWGTGIEGHHRSRIRNRSLKTRIRRRIRRLRGGDGICSRLDM